MASFTSLSIFVVADFLFFIFFVVADLKSLSGRSSVWVFLGRISVDFCCKLDV